MKNFLNQGRSTKKNFPQMMCGACTESWTCGGPVKDCVYAVNEPRKIELQPLNRTTVSGTTSFRMSFFEQFENGVVSVQKETFALDFPPSIEFSFFKKS